ncbi:MAG: HAD-IIA family hydrolase [Dermatophilaceae bacterium]
MSEKTPPPGDASLRARFRGMLFDLDGVVFRGHVAVPHAVEVINEMRAAGVGVAFVTNNASSPPEDVGDRLRGLGVRMRDEEVVTSAQAAAAYVARLVPPGAPVLAIGGPGVARALQGVGLVPVLPADRAAASRPVEAVLQGFGQDIGWSDLAEASYAVQTGVPWVATNGDLTIPMAGGIAPGNGSLLGCVRNASGVDPVAIVGKPHPPLYELAASVLGVPADGTLAIGDRLDTDIAGAVAVGMESLWVTTGANTPADTALAPPSHRPRFVACDLRGLREPYDDPVVDAQPGVYRATCATAEVTVAEGTVRDARRGTPNERLRAFIVACWAAADGGMPLDQDSVRRCSEALTSDKDNLADQDARGTS